MRAFLTNIYSWDHYMQNLSNYAFYLFDLSYFNSFLTPCVQDRQTSSENALVAVFSEYQQKQIVSCQHRGHKIKCCQKPSR